MKTLYMIDDDVVELKLMKKKIEKTCYNFQGTTEYKELLAWSCEKLPSVFIVDLMMPLINGYDIIQKLNTHFEHIKNIKIILFTAFSDKITLNKIKKKFNITVIDKNSKYCYEKVIDELNCCKNILSGVA